MKRILLIIGLLGCLAIPSMAENIFSGFISTATATICAGPTRIDWFHVANSSNAIATVTIYDGSTAKLVFLVPALADRSYPIPSNVKFNTSVKATSGDDYGVNKVKLYLNQW